MAVKKKYDRSVLGRGLDNIGSGRGLGLDALINTNDIRTKGTANLLMLPIDKIEPNPDQPRHEFDESALKELAVSIREIGVIVPITVREIDDEHYQIIAGERRWRASNMAGLKELPAYIMATGDEHVMEMALAENIQREDLNAIEIALAYQRLAETTGMTQERMSERLGKSRASITNYLRKNRDIDMGHARALLSLESPSAQLKLFKDAHRNGYSVRKIEEIVQRMKKGESLQEVKKLIDPKQLPLEYSILRDRLSELFKTKVNMTCSPQMKGKFSISFNNEEELEYIMQVFDKVKKSQK